MPLDPQQTPPLRVAVIGAGAVGSFLGGTLAAAGCDVTLLARRPGDESGTADLRIEEPPASGSEPASVTVTVRRTADAAQVEAPDLALMAVKAFDLEAALATASGWPGTAVMTAQNGVGAEALADAWIPYPAPLLAASLTSAVEPIEGGVRRLRAGGLGIAVVRDDDAGRGIALANRLAGLWSAGHLRARVYPDADAMKWSKLLANLVGNATSAILDMDPGAIYADPAGYAVERGQLREARAVMRALGLRPVGLPGADVRMLLRGIALPPGIGRPLVARGIARARGGKSPSLRLDVRGERPAARTEVGWLNGAVVAAGAAVGVATPVNAALASLVGEVAADPARAASLAGNPGRLAEAVAAWAVGP